MKFLKATAHMHIDLLWDGFCEGEVEGPLAGKTRELVSMNVQESMSSNNYLHYTSILLAEEGENLCEPFYISFCSSLVPPSLDEVQSSAHI